MKKDGFGEMLDDITNNGRADGRVITGNIYRRFGNTKGSMIVLVFTIIGVTAMAFMGLYAMGKKVLGLINNK